MSDYAPEFKVGDLVIKAGERIAELEAQLAAAQAEITRLRSGGCAREQNTTQWCAEAQRLAAKIDELMQVSAQNHSILQLVCRKTGKE